jgi:predicted Zn-dependent protease
MNRLLLILIFLFLPLFANELPELGSTFDNLINNADEKKIKFQIMQQVYSSNSVIRDPEINDYLEKMGNELISIGSIEKIDVNFFVLNDSSINAFAMLGNIIGIHSGLIFSVNSESELASVISHEIAHLSQKHLLRLIDSQAKNSYKSYFALAIALLAARSNPELARGAITAASASQTQNMLDYTRDNEREADRIGLTLLHEAGYDPKASIDFFSTMQKFNNFSSGAAPAFLRTHPVTTERISDIQDRLQEYKYIQRENKIEFYFIKSKLKALIGNYSEVIDLFKNEINLKRYVNEAASYYGLAYSFLRHNKIKEARDTFEKLSKININSPMILELNANILIKEKKYEEALELYRDALGKYPYHRAFILGVSNLIIQANKPDKAIELLNSNLLYFNKDPLFFQLLAKAYNQKEKYLLEHENLSDAYYHQFDIQSAIIQMDLAVKTPSENFFDKSRVEYRLNELKREAELMRN